MYQGFARTMFVYDNPHTGERWIPALVSNIEARRFREALLDQGCLIHIGNPESGDWNSIEWLRRYKPEAPLLDICLRAVELGTINTSARVAAALINREKV